MRLIAVALVLLCASGCCAVWYSLTKTQSLCSEPYREQRPKLVWPDGGYS